MGKTAIVTGGAGFVGSHLADSLLGDGYRVVVIDNLTTGDVRRLSREVELVETSLIGGGRAAFDDAVDKARPSRIFHLAGQASVPVSMTNPELDCRVNTIGTLHVLEAAQRVLAPVVFTSTSAVYGDSSLACAEYDQPAPTSPYGASKLAAEGYVRMFARNGRLPHAICRPGVIYGPRQAAHAESGAVAIFSRQLWRGERPVLYGYGEPTRDYVYVTDVVDALRSASGVVGTFNVATGVETSTRELLRLLQRVADTVVDAELVPLRDGEIKRSCLDPDYTAETLGWRARFSLAEGLGMTYPALVSATRHERLPAQA
jgi:UDP-glucose 4-epimerase